VGGSTLHLRWTQTTGMGRGRVQGPKHCQQPSCDAARDLHPKPARIHAPLHRLLWSCPLALRGCAARRDCQPDKPCLRQHYPGHYGPPLQASLHHSYGLRRVQWDLQARRTGRVHVLAHICPPQPLLRSLALQHRTVARQRGQNPQATSRFPPGSLPLFCETRPRPITQLISCPLHISTPSCPAAPYSNN
jgi:hypothetical protein